jgi:hypothetical protein
MLNQERAITRRRAAAATLLAWLSMVGFDLLLHGGLLAGFYVADDPFLLPPMQAFRLIPLGYASFLLNAILLVWLMRRLIVRTARDGAIFGVGLGAMIWGAGALALASITTARYAVLAGWFAGQTIEMSLAGGVAGATFARERLRGVVLFVVALMVACLVSVVILQSTGLSAVQHAG